MATPRHEPSAHVIPQSGVPRRPLLARRVGSALASIDRRIVVLAFAIGAATGLLLGATSTAHAEPRRTAPAISDVLAAAYRTAGLDHDLGRGFARRARLSGLVPWLSVRTGRDTSWHDDETDVARGLTIEVRATWRLDRLVFEGRELQVASMDAARRRERRRLAQRVIRIYFAWRRAVTRTAVRAWKDVDVHDTEEPDDAQVADENLPDPALRPIDRADELAAELDDLTDEWFSREVAARTPPP